MKIVVGLEEAAILEMFIRATYFLSNKPAQIPKQVWIILVVAFASFSENRSRDEHSSSGPGSHRIQPKGCN